MKVADILRQLADKLDTIDQKDTIEPEQDTSPEPISDKMINPLQQKQELLKKVAGVDNEYDRQDDEQASCGSDNDELNRMKKMVTMVIGGDETDIN